MIISFIMNRSLSISLVFVIFAIFLSLQMVSAIDFLVSSEPIKTSIINDQDTPATFDITITNNNKAGDFEIFTFERFEITPKEFSLDKDETKTIRFSFLPIDSMRKNVGHVSVPYFFREKGSSDNIENELTIKLISFKEAFDVSAENVNPESDSVVLSFFNIEDISYQEVNLIFSSPFFEIKNVALDLNPYEKRDFIASINKDELKKLVAGTYAIITTYTIDGRTESIERPIKILEKSGLSVSETSSGIIIRTTIIEKTNEGNIPTVANIDVRKNIISRLFTTFSLEPDRIERKGIYVEYTWQKELQPTEKLEVKTTTNTIFPLLLLIAVILIIYLFNVYVTTNLLIKKRVNFVRTKGGEFALKVTLNVKARKFMENVRIHDRLPAMSKLYENFGTKPDRFNHTSGIMDWNISRLAEGEERIFTYVIYSKLRVVGKFELPSANGIYEMEGKRHETKSNRTFFINEPREIKEEE